MENIGRNPAVHISIPDELNNDERGFVALKHGHYRNPNMRYFTYCSIHFTPLQRRLTGPSAVRATKEKRRRRSYVFHAMKIEKGFS